MITIITALMPLLMKLIGMYFTSKEAREDQRDAYKEFVMKMQQSQHTSAKLKLSYEEQLKALNEMSEKERLQ